MSSSNPRVHVGANSLVTEGPSVDHDANVQRIVRELNECKRDRRTLSDEEREIKDALKEQGFSPRIQAIALRALKSKRQEPIDVINQALRLASEDGFANQRMSFETLAADRSLIAKRERAIREQARELGVEVKALPIVRAMQDMDSIEREEFFDGIVNQCRALRFW